IGTALLLTIAAGYAAGTSKGFASIILSLFFIACLFLTIFFLLFFRDPERRPKGEEEDAVSPADGKVISIDKRTISIFMNIHNVHVNRAPLGGTVTHIDYKPGGYIPAFDKDSLVNERNHIVLSTGHGILELTQIAGILTRRIVSYISEGNIVKRGERIGMIRFGSRVDVVVPEGYEFVVGVNENVRAGETVMAIMKEKKGERNEREHL
ncbi:MAG TPA: phosphatidylserine decarboxylase, partial [Candidatus Methanoperedens sp.]